MGAELALGGLGLGLQYLQGREASGRANRAQRASDQAAAAQAGLLQRQSRLFDEIFGMARDADRAGAFDADRRFRQYETEASDQFEKASNATAAAARTMGYKPGDTPVLDTLRKQGGEFASRTAAARSGIEREALTDKFNAYNQANGGLLQSAAQGYGGLADRNAEMSAYYRSQVPNPGGLLASVMPYLNRQQKQFSLADYANVANTVRGLQNFRFRT